MLADTGAIWAVGSVLWGWPRPKWRDARAGLALATPAASLYRVMALISAGLRAILHVFRNRS